MDAASNNNVKWRDITDEFLSSAKQLNLGELLNSDHFTLLEAMSAMELMDPKMDSGMMLIKCNRKILNLDQSIRTGLVKISDLEFNELIGIIDETYSCLTTWLEGHSLAQTVMTNLYLHDPERIEDRPLRVFSLSILKLVNFMDKLVHLVYCIEEEDFQLNNGKFQLASHINEQKLATALQDLCNHFDCLLQETVLKKRQQPNNCDHIQSEKNLTAINERLRFTYNLYAFFSKVHKYLIVKDNWDTSPQTNAQIQKTIKLVQTSALDCDQHLEKCMKCLDKWSETIDLGIKPKSTQEEVIGEGCRPTIMGFEPLINYKLLPPAYPRCPSIRSRTSMIGYLRDLITKLRHCIAISNSFKCFSKSWELIESFSKYFQPSSCVVSRSFVQALYLPNRCDKLMKNVLLQSMTDFCEPHIQAIKKDKERFASLDTFLDESCKSFSQIIKLYGHNAARQHEKFADLIVHIKSLQCSAMTVHYAYNNTMIYSWIAYHQYDFYVKYVLSGLELELFSAYEYPYVFWFLYDYLYRNMRDQLDLAKEVVSKCQEYIDDDTKRKPKAKKQRKKNQYDVSNHSKMLLLIDAFRFLSGGTFLLTYGLRLQGKIRTPMMDFTSEKICLDHRFGPLTRASIYHRYQETVNRLDNLEYIYREALDCFSEAKVLFAATGKHENCVKVCKANIVVGKILSTNQNSFSDRGIEFSFDKHPSFPTVKV